jgi:ribosomal protein L11 methylase PrmA
VATCDDTFYSYFTAGALRSAKRLLPLLAKKLDIRSVLDIGCGRGAWLSVWRGLGVESVHGIDSEYAG